MLGFHQENGFVSQAVAQPQASKRKRRDAEGQQLFRFMADAQSENATLRAEVERLREVLRRRADMAFAFGELLRRDADAPSPASEP